MEPKKHIVIFSHAFGVRKDDLGLFSSLAEELMDNGIETVLFDYYDIDEKNNAITIKPLSQQVKVLEDIIKKSRDENPDAIIDIVAHSQGCLTPALLLPKDIRKTIFIAPSLDVDIQRMMNFFKDRPGTVINLDGISKLMRSDGTITIVPSLHWTDRANAEPISLYNKLSEFTEITIIKANQDNTLGSLDISGLSENIKIINLDGSHNFNGESRQELIKIITEIIL